MTWRANNAAVVACSSWVEARTTVNRLIEAGYDPQKVSVAARLCSSNGDSIACYSLAGRTEGWGDDGRFWAALWRTLSGRGVFVLPSYGPVLVAGPLVEWVARALNNAGIFDGFSAVGAALYGIGLSRDVVPELEAALDARNFLVVIYGSSKEVEQAGSVLAVEELSDAA